VLRVSRDQAELRVEPGDDARLLRTLNLGESLFLVDNSDSTWLGVRVVTSGMEGWIRHENVTLVSRSTKTLYVVHLPEGRLRPVTILLHKKRSNKSGGIRLNPGTALIMIDRSNGWRSVAAITPTGIRHGWINYERVHNYLHAVKVPTQSVFRRALRESSTNNLWLMLCSGLAGALLTALVALYVAAASQKGLRAIVLEGVERFATVMAAHAGSARSEASPMGADTRGTNVIGFPSATNAGRRRAS
jgi:hypothetical protein